MDKPQFPRSEEISLDTRPGTLYRKIEPLRKTGDGVYEMVGVAFVSPAYQEVIVYRGLRAGIETGRLMGCGAWAFLRDFEKIVSEIERSPLPEGRELDMTSKGKY